MTDRMKWWQWPLVIAYGLAVCGGTPFAVVLLANVATGEGFTL